MADRVKENRQAQPMRVVFLVQNVAANDIALIRAQGFVRCLPDRFMCRIAARTGLGQWADIKHFWNEIKRFRPDIVYCQGEGLIALIPALLARARFGVPFIIDTGDIAELLARKVVAGFAARWKVILTERLTLRLASAIVVRGTYHRRYLAERGFNNIWVIQDGADMTEDLAGRDPELQNRLGLANYFVIGLMGNSIWNDSLGMCYGWDLVEAVALLKDHKIKGLMIGGGDGIEHLRHRAEELGLSNRIVFTGRLPYDDIGRHLRLIDVALSTQTNDPVGWARTTGKLPEYLKAGCYVLASAVGEASLVLPPEMLIEYDGGGRDDSYPLRLAERITSLINKRILIQTQRKNMLLLARHHFDYRSLSEKLADCLTATVTRLDGMFEQKG